MTCLNRSGLASTTQTALAIEWRWRYIYEGRIRGAEIRVVGVGSLATVTEMLAWLLFVFTTALADRGSLDPVTVQSVFLVLSFYHSHKHGHASAVRIYISSQNAVTVEIHIVHAICWIRERVMAKVHRIQFVLAGCCSVHHI